MLFRPKLHDIDIPEVPPDTQVVWSKAQLKHAAVNQDSFVRAVTISTRECGELSLDEVVGTTDVLLSEAARQIGASVVRHEWGLYKVPKKRGNGPGAYSGPRNDHPTLPKGYMLVADVAAVKPTAAWNTAHPLYEYVDRSCFEIDSGAIAGEVVLSDLDATQCVYGTAAGNTFEGVHIVDIEPRVTKASDDRWDW